MFRRHIGRATPIPTSSASTGEIDKPVAWENVFDKYAAIMLAVTAGCLPLYVVRWKVGPISTTLLELLVLATTALYVLGRRRDGVFRLERTRYDIPIVLLLLAGAIAVLVPSDRWHALGLYRAYFLEPIAIFYVAIDLLRRPGPIRRVLLAIGLGSSVFAIL
ncbi:MAG: hypothetical protein ABI959_08780, partial [Candidatus Dormiibacterota bacterium]